MAALSASAVWFFYSHGWLQWYGDAEAHLDNARRIFDSQRPGYDQLGSPWLPIPHLLLLPFVRVDSLWHSGLAAAFPSAAFFVMGGVFLFAAARRIFDSNAAALTATALAALNPNILYLQSTSMTEAIFFGCFMALLYFTVRGWPAAAGLAACACTLTRYEGWFLLPFVAPYFLKQGLRPAIVFSAIAGAGPVYWLFHNWYLTNDAFHFFRGEGSAKAIQGDAVYAGKDNWRLAFYYYRHAAALCAGPVLVILGIAGTAAAIAKRALWPLLLLALPPVFYVWSVHSSSLPIHLPYLWPHGYYNTRYGLAALPLLAFAAAALVAVAPYRVRGAAAVVAVLATAGWWLAPPSPERWITWVESRANSTGRRGWVEDAAEFLSTRYVRGSGIITSWDLAAIYRRMGIPLREAFNVCDGLPWEATVRRPDLHLYQEWAVVAQDDQVDRALRLAAKSGVIYELEKTIVKKDERVIKIYHRTKGLR